MHHLQLHYSFFWVSVSVVVAVASCVAAMIASYRIKAAPSPWLRRFWLTTSSLALGLGFWAMQFLGMLAVTLPVPTFYSWPIVLVSLSLAIAASSVALHTVTGIGASKRKILVGGGLLGLGISSMHYTGMAAIRAAATKNYTPPLVVLCVAIAVSFSLCATWIASFSRSHRYAGGLPSRVGAGIVMAIGIIVMHYVSMSGLSFTRRDSLIPRGALIHVDDLGRILITFGVGLVVVFLFCMAMLDTWRQRQLRRAEIALRNQNAILADRKQLRETNQLLNELSVRDSLTGLFNRRCFAAALQTEWNRADRTAGKLSLLMMDLDCFKSLNDHYGHLAGDACLRDVARCLTNQKRRSYDILARYGGEEFVLLLPGADKELARGIAEALRQAVNDLKIPNEHSRTCGVVTISIGVACAQGRQLDHPDTFLRMADEALYEAKRCGGNCVCAAAD